jgi:CBS domain-containing protein
MSKETAMLVKDVINTSVIYTKPQSTLLEAAEQMIANRIDTLLVMENDELLGVIGLRDLFTAPIPAHYGNRMLRHDSEEQLLSVWETMPVRNLMNEKIITVNEDVTMLRALELMVNSGKHPLPVLRAGKVIGIVSRMDIVRALIAQRENSV